MSKSKSKVYVTKYALTKGIRLCTLDHGSENYDYAVWPGYLFEVQCRRGRESHETELAALERAAEMARAKIKTLKRSLARTKSMLGGFERDRELLSKDRSGV